MEPNLLPTISLTYESADPSASHRPKWVWAIVILYGLLLAALLTIPAWLADDRSSFLQLMIILLILAGCWFSLLMIPLRSVRRRPTSRNSIWIPMLASGVLIGLLCFGATIAIAEYRRSTVTDPLLLAFPIGWSVWSLVFWLISRRSDPVALGSRLHRYVLSGSVLELLIAVPTHIVVRQRHDCCAGIYTGMGICAGIAVMLVGFGPSVLFLYYRRFKQISNQRN